jgi:hypothetical protein
MAAAAPLALHIKALSGLELQTAVVYFALSIAVVLCLHYVFAQYKDHSTLDVYPMLLERTESLKKTLSSRLSWSWSVVDEPSTYLYSTTPRNEKLVECLKSCGAYAPSFWGAVGSVGGHIQVKVVDNAHVVNVQCMSSRCPVLRDMPRRPLLCLSLALL